MTLTLISPAFADGDRLPEKYARGDRNLSPPLRWHGAPDGTRSFALLVEDPDAPGGTFRHWAIYNLDPERTELHESIETGPERGDLRVGVNDFGNHYYDGPAPPPGDPPHHYHFRLLALDVPSLSIPAQAGADEIADEARKHVIEEAELVATYGG
ncbi:YbhB/YbcL family Raf kinase inhibitor-like protein [Dichotomicrobium thermohalophilum]|uniref:PBP family phospholipid-binding protein n=1 Tax=Dichotomicrobium thermohalophilum TaxID=933063 RepID=A0A397PIH4_9HYPH|nr:YbhB/YbcL family Raf kinase inhibitor-like protein [Dichotomicrobium thermohalophilum]RIA45471.1 PBP family phospholipid-binding protein [Dichotomicrobium thermohalophilum]